MLSDVRLPVIDRAAVERLFGLRRRQAIELLNRFGGYQAGRTFLIGREQLISQLDSMAASGEYRQEAARRERLAGSIEKIQRTRQTEAVRIPVAAGSVWQPHADAGARRAVAAGQAGNRVCRAGGSATQAL